MKTNEVKTITVVVCPNGCLERHKLEGTTIRYWACPKQSSAKATSFPLEWLQTETVTRTNDMPS